MEAFIERLRALPGFVENQALAALLIERVRANLDLIALTAVTFLCLGLALPRP